MTIRTTHLMTAIVLACTLTAVAQEKKIERSVLPPAVEKTVQAESRGAIIKGFTTERENGKRTYEAEMTVNGRSRDIEIAEDGTLNEVEDEVAFASLPAKVQSALMARAAGAMITKVESLTRKNKLVAYEAAITKGMKKSEIQVSPAGEKLSHEE